MAMQKYAFYRGLILNPQSDKKCDFLPDGLMVVKDGKIKDLLPFPKGLKKYSKLITSKNIVDFKHSVILPSFFDAILFPFFVSSMQYSINAVRINFFKYNKKIRLLYFS